MPQIGVVAVAVRRVAVTTHVYWVCDPSTAPMIFGSALETTVLLKVETNSASIRPLIAFSTLRRDAGDASTELESFTAVLREEQKILTHRRLIDAAVTVFAEKSFLDARMEDIAQAAGVTRATVYAHFPGKAEIIDALVERVYGLMGETYADLASLPHWTQAGIRTWLDGAAARCREMAPIRRVANAASPAALRSISDGRKQYVEAHEHYVDILVGDLRRWRGTDPAEARQRALMAVLQTESFFSTWIAIGWPLDTTDPLRLLADSLCHLLAPALENERTPS